MIHHSFCAILDTHIFKVFNVAIQVNLCRILILRLYVRTLIGDHQNQSINKARNHKIDSPFKCVVFGILWPSICSLVLYFSIDLIN